MDLLQLFESAGIEVWLDGGWAVDALLGVRTRPHKDVDIVLRVADLPKLQEILVSKSRFPIPRLELSIKIRRDIRVVLADTTSAEAQVCEELGCGLERISEADMG